MIASLWSLSLCASSDLYNEKVSSLGVTAQLHCSNSTQYLTAAPNDSVYAPVLWMLPDLTLLYVDQGRFQVLNNNWTLRIVNVSSDDLGLYHCVLRSTGVQWMVLRLGLNVRGPYFEDLWDKYRINTVRGFSASVGFLLIAVAVCLVYHFRYQPEDDGLSGQHGELSGNDGTGTVVDVVVRDEARENWKECTQSTGGGSSTLDRDVVDVYPGSVDQQYTTRL